MGLLPRSVQSQQKPSSPAFGTKRSTSTTLAPSARSGVWGGKTKIMGDSQMSDQKRVKIKYKPRDQFKAFHNRKQRWSVPGLPPARRQDGRDVNDLIRGAVNECKPEGQFGLVFSRSAIKPRTQHGAICVGTQSHSWRSHRTNPKLRVDLVNRSMIRRLRRGQPRCVTWSLPGWRCPRRICGHEAGGLARGRPSDVGRSSAHGQRLSARPKAKTSSSASMRSAKRDPMLVPNDAQGESESGIISSSELS